MEGEKVETVVLCSTWTSHVLWATTQSQSKPVKEPKKCSFPVCL